MRWGALLSTLFTTIAFVQGTVTADIVEIEYMSQVEDHLEEATHILLDLDYTVFKGGTMWGSADWFYAALKKGLAKGKDKKEIIDAFYPLWVSSQRANGAVAIESSIPERIGKWQREGYAVMGLTHRQPSVAMSTLRQLEGLSIDFSLSAPSSLPMTLPLEYNPCYSEGVLFVVDYNDKGEVLKRFLDAVGCHPRRILFVDDGIANVFSLERMCQKSGIEYTGCHYRRYEKVSVPFDEEVMALQRRLYGHIISDSAASYLLERELITMNRGCSSPH